MKSLRRFYWFIVLLFVLAESGLYYLTAQVFIPGGAEYAKLILALFLGLVVMVILNFSFEKHFIRYDFNFILDGNLYINYHSVKLELKKQYQ